MREILFRGKRKDNGEWVEGMLAKDQKGNFRIQYDPYYFSVIVIPSTIGEFAVVYDNTGKSIFEGDIIVWIDPDGRERIDTVKWRSGGLVLCNDQYTVGSYTMNQIKVIGNVHDNPELL